MKTREGKIMNPSDMTPERPFGVVANGRQEGNAYATVEEARERAKESARGQVYPEDDRYMGTAYVVRLVETVTASQVVEFVYEVTEAKP